MSDAKATERAPDPLQPGKDYMRNITVAVPLSGVGTIGIQAERIRLELGEAYAEHEITGYELVVRVFVTGGRVDAGAGGEEATGDNVA